MVQKELSQTDREIFLQKAPIWNRLSMAKLVTEFLPYLNDGEEMPEPLKEQSRVMQEDKLRFEHPENITREEIIDRLESFVLEGVIGLRGLDCFSEDVREEVEDFLHHVNAGRN